MDGCIFCKIVKGELPSVKVWEDAEVLAFLDIQPINKGHVLIIPKQHGALISEIDDNILCSMIKLAKKIGQALRDSELKPAGVNLFLADGKAAGQEVPHVHLHIIPRFDQDGFGLVFPESHKNKPPKEELEAISEKIRARLN